MKFFLLLSSFLIIANHSYSQKENLNKVVAGFPVNYEEELVKDYILPDVLTLQNGKKLLTLIPGLQSDALK